jgi:hypothetical protein
LNDPLLRASGRSVNNQLYVMQELRNFLQRAATEASALENPSKVDVAFMEAFNKNTQHFGQFYQQYQRLR